MARQRWRAYYGGGAMSSSASCPSFVLLITPRFSPACTGSVAVAALPVHDTVHMYIHTSVENEQRQRSQQRGPKAGPEQS